MRAGRRTCCGFGFGLVGVNSRGVEFVGEILGTGAGVVEVRLVDGGLGRIGLGQGFSPLIRFLDADIGQRRRTGRLEGFGHRRGFVGVFSQQGGGFGFGLVVGRCGRWFEPSRVGRFDRSFSLRRVAVDG
jgi:hypothetical protein